MKIRFFEPGLTYRMLKPELDAAYERVMSNGDLILRKDVEEFEKSLADFVGTKYAVALNSCTDALYLALRYLKIGPGDHVIVPSRTFVATVQVVVQLGATPVFYDVDGSFEKPITLDWPKVKAIIPVHIEGALDTHLETILSEAKEHGIPVIEDAAQALGAVLEGELQTKKEGGVEVDYRELKKAGSIGLAGCFSFYPAKILGAFGDAGALTTDDEGMYEYVKEARNHFKNDARDWGINSRLDNLQAAFLNVRFKRLPEMLVRREEIAERYLDGLKGLAVDGIFTDKYRFLFLPSHTPGRVWQDYIIRTSKRNELFDFLKAEGIETMKNNYPFPVPKLPGAQAYEDETLRLPCNENLTDEEVDHVIAKVNEFFKSDAQG